jgi:2-polyprenyl-6-methoxyphenol hydroxylase-like FAD-dependent oxidoreductase
VSAADGGGNVHDVAIVGLGPVGAVLAILLGQQGHDVVVVERHTALYPLPRAVHFDHEVGRILQSCGVGAALPGITEPQNRYEWRNATGDTLLSFRSDGGSPSGWPASSMFSQPVLETLLAQRLAELPTVTVRRGLDVSSIERHDEGVTLHTGDGAVHARWVVGCDGANSTVRDQVGASVTDLGFFFDWLIVDVVFNEPRHFDPSNMQICDPLRPTTVVSGGPGRRRWEFMRLPDEDEGELGQLATAWRLLEPFDVTPHTCRIERHAVYRFQARWVDEWRHGRVLLAGDAAHQMPPFAGQGMCSGIRDAANLAWKLHAVLDGHATSALLDTYTPERSPNVRAYIEFSMSLGEVICVPDPEQAAARDQAMIAMQSEGGTPPPPMPGLGAGLVCVDQPGAGRLMLQARVAVDGSAPALFDDAFGAGWRLITVEPVDVADDMAAWFASIGGAVVHIDRAVDVDGAYRRWMDSHEVTVALQRPDFYVFGSGTDAAGLLGELREHWPRS